jgi:hypothetical protein
MNGQRIQFSIADIFLGTFVVGLMCLGVQLGVRQHPAIVVLVLIFGIPMAIGSLLAGVKGLRNGFLIGVGTIASFVVFAMVLVLLALLAAQFARWK